MSEWFVLVYAVVLFTGLMLAARWQPKGSPKPTDEPATSQRKGRRPRH
jgi:hypothetical protein